MPFSSAAAKMDANGWNIANIDQIAFQKWYNTKQAW
jgi:hypothetical protein